MRWESLRGLSDFPFTGYISCALGLSVFLGCSIGTAPDYREPHDHYWLQAWGDECGGAACAPIDSTKLRRGLGVGCSAGICCWGNNEKEYYTSAPENIALNGQGQLMIVARQAPAGLSCYYGPCRFTSAKITTRGTMLAAPGRVEARIKIPAGQGLWPAFWMLGEGHPTVPWPQSGEIDILENKGSQPASMFSAVHGPGYSGATAFAHVQTLATGAFADDFHTFAVAR